MPNDDIKTGLLGVFVIGPVIGLITVFAILDLADINIGQQEGQHLQIATTEADCINQVLQDQEVAYAGFRRDYEACDEISDLIERGQCKRLHKNAYDPINAKFEEELRNCR